MDRVDRALAALLLVVLTVVAGIVLGIHVTDVLVSSESEPFSNVHAAVSVLAVLSVYANVTEKGLEGLLGVAKYINTGLEGDEAGLFRPVLNCMLATFLCASCATVYLDGEDKPVGAETGETPEVHNCQLTGEVKALREQTRALGASVQGLNEIREELALDAVAAFPLMLGNAKARDGRIMANSYGVSAQGAVNHQRLQNIVQAIDKVVRSRAKAGCSISEAWRIDVIGYASDAEFVGFENSDELNLEAATLRAESARGELEGLLDEAGLGSVVVTKPKRWETLDEMRSARPAVDADAANLQESDRWLFERSVHIEIGEPPPCFAEHVE